MVYVILMNVFFFSVCKLLLHFYIFSFCAYAVLTLMSFVPFILQKKSIDSVIFHFNCYILQWLIYHLSFVLLACDAFISFVFICPLLSLFISYSFTLDANLYRNSKPMVALDTLIQLLNLNVCPTIYKKLNKTNEKRAH